MKGKIILSFILALIALGAIGYLGQRGLKSMIASIEEASQPNEKLAGLNEIMQSLSDAESSVRSYIITRNQGTLGPFTESAATIQLKLTHLKDITRDEEQLQRLTRLNALIDQKYANLRNLINVRSDQDGNVLRKVSDDIEKLKAEAEEKQSEEGGAKQNPEVYSKLFGEDPSREDSAAMDPGISSREINQAITRIGKEENRSSRQLMEQELNLTEKDNEIMGRIRGVIVDFQQAEVELSSTRTENIRVTSEKTIHTITTVLVITLFVFAFLLSIIFNDIRRSRRNREQLRQAKDKAEKLARVKEEFLSNMSHEIRTPLNAIIGFTEQLQDSALDFAQNQHLTRIKSSGDHLLRLINDILDYAKMESGKMELELTGFRIKSELEEVLALFGASIARKNLTLTSSVEKDVPEIVLGDSVRFRQILINLINNSIKFTESGGIHVRIDASTEGTGTHKIILSVTDTGIGIAAEKLDSIFDDFSQADSSTARKYGGSGLGLSIVNKLAILHKGNVTVESSEGEGTTFHVTMYYQEGTIEDIPEITRTVPADLSGLRALVVDDQPYNLELLQLILSKWNMECVVCPNGPDALQQVSQTNFDIILLDIQMPGMSGLEVAGKMFTESLIPSDQPVVALTAGTGEEDQQRARAAGMQYFLPKPFTQAQLKSLIITACDLNPDAIPQEPVPERSISEGLQLDGLMELANGDMQFVINMLTIFKNNFISDAAALNKAADESDWLKVKSVAHKMSPPCGHLGFSGVAKALKKIEQAATELTDQESLRNLIDLFNYKSSGIITEIDHKISELDPNKQHV